MLHRRRLVISLIALMMLSGCSSRAPAGGATAEATQIALASAPGSTAHTIVDNGAMIDLDPGTACMGEVRVFGSVYETLTRYNLPGAENEILPGLATSWTHSEDGRMWTFQLRQGAKFHDGSEVNAAAVKYSIERTKALGVCSAYLLDPIQAIETPDPYTVIFHLDEPVALDGVLANAYQSWIMSPTAVADHDQDWFADGRDAGSGPYLISQFERGQRLVLQRFDDYWGGWEPGQLSTVIFEVVNDKTVAEQMVRAGQTDFATSIDLTPEQMVSLAASGEYHLDASPSNLDFVIYLNHRRAPTNDRLVRQALSYSFPYDEVQANFTLGKSTRAHGPVPAHIWGHMPEIGPYDYDPDKARTLLAEAGYGGGLDLTLAYFQGSDMVAELWQAAAAKAGIRLNLEVTDFPTISDQVGADPERAPHAMSSVGLPDIVDPYAYLYIGFHSEAKPPFNLGVYQNPAFDALIEEGHRASVTDRATATNKFVQAQEILAEDAAAIVPLDLVAFHLIRSDLTGYASNPAYSEAVFWYDLRRTADQ